MSTQGSRISARRVALALFVVVLLLVLIVETASVRTSAASALPAPAAGAAPLLAPYWGMPLPVVAGSGTWRSGGPHPVEMARSARWSDIQRRADDLAQTLYALREQVPQHFADWARIADTLASLQAVRSAMDAERAPGGASLEQTDVVRSRLASFESSLQALEAARRE